MTPPFGITVFSLLTGGAFLLSMTLWRTFAALYDAFTASRVDVAAVTLEN